MKPRSVMLWGFVVFIPRNTKLCCCKSAGKITLPLFRINLKNRLQLVNTVLVQLLLHVLLIFAFLIN